MICAQCGKTTENAKFCSRSCSATFNNKIPKRSRVPRSCIRCGEDITYTTRTDVKTCELCRHLRIDYSSLTLSEIRRPQDGGTSQHSILRWHARNVYNASRTDGSCELCGYSKHIQIHHLVPVSWFPDKATVAEVNALDNLIGLCPNHHWEMEHGLLELIDSI